MFDAVKKLDTSRVCVAVLSPRSSGRSGESTTVRPAVNMNGAALKLAVI